MATEGEKAKWRWQFGLRSLPAATLMVGVGLGLFAHWWTTPVVDKFWAHRNGVVGYEEWSQRDWRGRLRTVKTIGRYSTGRKLAESKGFEEHLTWWLPDGTAATAEHAVDFLLRDNGDGTFREPGNAQ
jgi:hypothetical protein